MPLTYVDRGESKSETIWTVLAGGVYVGSISKIWQSVMSRKHGEKWDWRLAIQHGPAGYQNSGVVGSLAEAKAELEKNWSLWLEAVMQARD